MVEGFLTRAPNKGFIGRPLDAKQVFDLYEFRGALESSTARIAWERATAEELDELESFVKGKEKAAGGTLAVGRIEESVAAGDATPLYLSRNRGLEFIMLLPGQDLAQARKTLEELQSEIAASAVPDAAGVTVTLSCGLAQLAHDEDPRAVLRSADEALHRAKADGGNAVVTA